MRLRSSIVAMPLVVLLAGRSGAQSDDAARKAVEQLHQEFIAALKTGDATAATEGVTSNRVEEDSTCLEGRTAIAAAAKELLSSFKVPLLTITTASFRTSGNVAWATVKETGSFVDETGRATPVAVQFLSVYERRSDGKYVCRYWLEKKLPVKTDK